MKWDLLAMRFPPDVHSFDELPCGFPRPDIGSRAQVIAAMRAFFPALKVSGQRLVTLQTETFTIKAAIGEDETCCAIMFHVFGDGVAAVPLIQDIAESLRLRVWDTSSREFLDEAADPAKGYKRLKEFLDNV